jgi:acrylyl-CoA reductase (NADPH)
MTRRIEAWHRLQSELPLDLLEIMTIKARLDEVPRLAAEILKGHVRGRVVVDVNG